MSTFSSLVIVGAMLIGAVPVGAAGAADESSVEGVWLGSLEVPSGELRTVFNLARGEDGKLTGTVDSPDQGSKGIPISSISLKDDLLRIEVIAVGGWFEGRLGPDGDQVEGTWHQSGLSLPLTVRRVDEVPELNRPQVPTRPYPYAEEEVSYENEEDGARLAATLTYPKSGGPFPAVVLITGSGPQDRDETVFGHKPFLVLADYLTRQGVAVLRADDRGVGGSAEGSSAATFESPAGDALAGLAYLKTREDIDPQRIGMLGHSEGAIMAAMAAVQSSDVSFIVLLAGTGVTGERVILEQQDLILKAEGAPEAVIAEKRAETEQYLAVVRQEQDHAAAAKRLEELISARLAGMTEEEKVAAGGEEVIRAQTDAAVAQMLDAWFRRFLSYDPKPTLAQVRVPVLALWGEKDLQVPPKQNLPPLEETLKSGGHQHYTVAELPGLNHLFQTATTGSVSEYARIEETMSPTALSVIGDWILEQTRLTGQDAYVEAP